jgi:tetratricopeptide (TPR) repeat protein
MTEEQALERHARAQQLQCEGRHEEALAELEAAAGYFEGENPQSPDLANALADWSESLIAVCRYAEAEQKARRAKEIVAAVRDLLDRDSRGALLPRIYSMWGRSLRELGRYEEAFAPIDVAIHESEGYYGPEHPEVASYLNEYGIVCKYSGRFDEGLQRYRRALEILERTFGKEAPETASIYHNLGGLEHSRGNFAEGEPYARTAYEIRRCDAGEDDAATVADAVAWGGLLDGLERYSDSVPIYLRALKYYEEKFGPDHFEVAATLNNLGMARAAQGNLDEARALMQRCLAIKRKLFEESHPEVQLSLRNVLALEED